jgi:DNA polymerase (family 10)
VTNADAARIFYEVANLLEIKGADAFRVNSYRRVARTLEDLPVEVSELAAGGKLDALPAVGKTSAARLTELLSTGRLALRDELTAEVPETLLELLRIPSLGPKKVAMLWKERGVTTIAELESAIADGRLAGLKGLGDKSIEKLREGIAFLKRVAGRTRLGVAWAVAQRIRDAVRAMPGVTRAEHAGSLRRGAETVGDLDLLCVADDGAAVTHEFTQIPGVSRVLAAGETKASVLYEYRTSGEIQCDLRVVPAGSFGAAWQYFTGSKEHNVRLRERAVKRGWTLNEYALTDEQTGAVIAAAEEAEIYAALGLPHIPPELREDRGECELAEVPADLLTLRDIRGDVHMHTVASDGRNTIEEMVVAALARGYEYICITDHSPSSVIANGLKPDRLLRHIEHVRNVAERLRRGAAAGGSEAARRFTLWVGAEVDIHADGSLDYADDVLARLDFVVASIHAGMGTDIRHNTERALSAIGNPYVNLLAHPTGRLINKRDAMPLDIEAIAREAARTGTALEINASEYRLDLKDQHARLARDLGATICINCDAHSTEQLDQMRFGVATARRAWLRRGEVLNARTAEAVAAFVRAKRAR